MKTPVLRATNEYRLFKSDPTNRSPRKLKKLIASMRQWGFLPAHPVAAIPSGSHMIVKDGQHRLAAAKELGIPIWYVCSEAYEPVSIPEINQAGAGRWNPRDYIESFCNQGNPEYAKLRNFVDTHRVPPIVAASLLYGQQGGSSNIRELLNSGRFKVRDYTYAVNVATVIAAASTYVTWARCKGFIDAVSKAMWCVNADALVAKIHAMPGLLILQPTSDAFLEMLDGIFNYKSRKPIPLKYLANEAAKKRNPAVKA